MRSNDNHYEDNNHNNMTMRMATMTCDNKVNFLHDKKHQDYPFAVQWRPLLPMVCTRL